MLLSQLDVMACVKIVKAALARAMFALHAFITLWRLVSQGKDSESGKAGLKLVYCLSEEFCKHINFYFQKVTIIPNLGLQFLYRS